MRAFEAARVLYKHGQVAEAQRVLQFLWEAPDRRADQEFDIFCALMEIWAFERPKAVLRFFEVLVEGDGDLQAFWERRSIAERAVLFDWHGQFCLHFDKTHAALDSLGRAASLGRDTSLIWRQLGMLYVHFEDLDLGLRYIRRSLQLFRQLDFDILSGRDNPPGAFTGEHPLKTTHSLEDYLHLLLLTTRLAQGQRNLRSVRELVVEMIHQFPNEDRLSKIRLLIEKSIVEHSLEFRGSAALTAL